MFVELVGVDHSLDLQTLLIVAIIKIEIGTHTYIRILDTGHQRPSPKAHVSSVQFIISCERDILTNQSLLQRPPP